MLSQSITEHIQLKRFIPTDIEFRRPISRYVSR